MPKGVIQSDVSESLEYPLQFENGLNHFKIAMGII